MCNCVKTAKQRDKQKVFIYRSHSGKRGRKKADDEDKGKKKKKNVVFLFFLWGGGVKQPFRSDIRRGGSGRHSLLVSGKQTNESE